VQVQDSGGTVVRIDGNATVGTIAEIHQRLVAGFAAEDGVVIDASGIGEADLTFIQLIESARLTAARQGRQIRLSAPAGAELLEMLTRGGFLNMAGGEFWLQAGGG
jgi:hypothetical protein